MELFGQMRETLRRERAIKAELLAALEALDMAARGGLDQSATHDGLTNCAAIAKARAAIAKAKGGAQ